jgi:peptide/nickel transport system permease protein
LRDQLGLNAPLYVQYGTWLRRVVHGDLGYSIRQQVPVADLVVQKFENTLLLGSVSFLFAMIVGLLVGFLAGLRRGSWLDKFTMVLASSGLATPAFFSSLLLAYVFGYRLRLLPVGGMHSLQGNSGVGDLLPHLVLPVLALSIGPVAVVSRLTRSSTIEVAGADFVRTARGKGLSEQSVAWRHILKNALIPMVHLLGLQAGNLLSITSLVEIVFSWPGLGWLMVDSILTRDLPLTQGCVLAIALLYAVVSVAADAVHTILDPRAVAA